MRNRTSIWWITVLVSLLYMSNRAYSAVTYTLPPELRCVCEIRTEVQGSGTLVAVNDKYALVLTCRHVALQGGQPARFRWLNAGGQVTKGMVLETMSNTTDIEWETDLALAACFKPKNVTPVTIALYDPEDGPWFGVGFVSGHLNIVQSKHCVYSNGCLVFDEMFIPGQSGGPVFNRRGELVGVVVAYNKKWHIGVAVDGPNLQKIIKKYDL